MCKRTKRASASRRAGRLPTPNYLPISWRKFEDCALDATLFFTYFVLLLRLVILFKAKRLFVLLVTRRFNVLSYYFLRRHQCRVFCSQVWFQNARAKWRRMVTKQENKMAEKCSPDASLEMDLYHGPMGSIQSLPPHSPPYSVMGGPPSPNSMDCP